MVSPAANWSSVWISGFVLSGLSGHKMSAAPSSTKDNGNYVLPSEKKYFMLREALPYKFSIAMISI